MTDKEMHKLSRRELLQLLLAQVSETEDLKGQLNKRDEQLTELCENYEKLRKRLDQKDTKIHELRESLREERTTRRIELQEAGSIAEAALRLNGIFEMAQKAADQYLENVKRLYEEEPSGGEGADGLDEIEDEDGWKQPQPPENSGEEAPKEPPENSGGEASAEPPENSREEASAEPPENSGEEASAEPPENSGEETSAEPPENSREEASAEPPEDAGETLAEEPPGKSGEDDWAELPEGRDDDWARLPDTGEDIWAGEPEDESGEAAVTEEIEIGEDAPMEFAGQDGQRTLWEEKGKKKRKGRWRRRALSR